MGRKDLDERDLSILEVLKRGEATWSEIKRRTGLDHVLLHRRLKRLERLGLVHQRERRGPWLITRRGLEELERKRKDKYGLGVSRAKEEVREVRASIKEGSEGLKELRQYLRILLEDQYAEVAVLEILNLLYLTDLALIEEMLHHNRSLDEAARMLSPVREEQLKALGKALKLPESRWIEGRERFKELLRYMWYPVVFRRVMDVLRMMEKKEKHKDSE